MKVEKVFCIGRKYPEDFDKEIIDYLVNDYGCDRDIADIRLHNCLAFWWALCESPKGIVGIQTNYDRSEIKVGQWNGNLLGEYVRGWNIQSLIFMERNDNYYVWLQRI